MALDSVVLTTSHHHSSVNAVNGCMSWTGVHPSSDSTHWTGHQSVTGLTNTDKPPFATGMSLDFARKPAQTHDKHAETI